MSGSVDLKDLTPRAQFEILRLYLQWRIRNMTETREEKRARNALRLPLPRGKVAQQDLANACGVSIGEINTIVHRHVDAALRSCWPEILRYTGYDVASGAKAALRWFLEHVDAPECARYERARAGDVWNIWRDYDDHWLARQMRMAKRTTKLSKIPERAAEAVRILEREFGETREEIWLQAIVDVAKDMREKTAFELAQVALSMCRR